jgi:hypothetical protein
MRTREQIVRDAVRDIDRRRAAAAAAERDEADAALPAAIILFVAIAWIAAAI